MPNDWKLFLNEEQIFVNKNFGLIRFYPPGWKRIQDGEVSPDIDDILILNLVSRKQFWMREQTLVSKIKAKMVTNVWRLPLSWDWSCLIKQIKVKNNGITINCKRELGHADDSPILGHFEKN